MAEAVMMTLAASVGRQEAHDMVASAIRSYPERSLTEAIAAAGISIDAAIFEPNTYLGTAQRQIDDAIEEFGQVSKNPER